MEKFKEAVVKVKNVIIDDYGHVNDEFEKALQNYKTARVNYPHMEETDIFIHDILDSFLKVSEIKGIQISNKQELTNVSNASKDICQQYKDIETRGLRYRAILSCIKEVLEYIDRYPTSNFTMRVSNIIEYVNDADFIKNNDKTEIQNLLKEYA